MPSGGMPSGGIPGGGPATAPSGGAPPGGIPCGTALGSCGGGAGAAGWVGLSSGRALNSKGMQTIPAGDRLRLDMPGGGGCGDPFTRDPARVAADVRDGLVSPDAARDLYGVVIGEDGAIDDAATARMRG